MKEFKTMRQIAILALAMGLGCSPLCRAQDAEALLKKSGCTKCHAVSAKKDGPSFKDVAAKYKGKPDAEAIVTKQITTGPMIRIEGHEERHDVLKTKDAAEIRSVVAYILSR
jgi:cytochrome c